MHTTSNVLCYNTKFLQLKHYYNDLFRNFSVPHLQDPHKRVDVCWRLSALIVKTLCFNVEYLSVY